MKRLSWPQDLAPTHVELGASVEITQDKSWLTYVISVLRAKKGQTFWLMRFDEQRALEVQLETAGRRAVTVKLAHWHEKPESRTTPQITLAMSLIKESRWEWCLQKATELGVSTIQPLLTDYTSVKHETVEKKGERWHSLLEAAALQSERWSRPELLPVQPYKQWLNQNAKDSECLLCVERGKLEAKSLLDLTQHTASQRLTLAVGPEGGWSEAELEASLASGLQPVHLGPAILRAETAALAGLSLLLCR